jgi:hypothetical protein
MALLNELQRNLLYCCNVAVMDVVLLHGLQRDFLYCCDVAVRDDAGTWLC